MLYMRKIPFLHLSMSANIFLLRRPAMKSIKMIFLEKTVLGRKTDLRNPEDVILHCINLAYRDMLTAGRYYIKANITSTCNNFKTLLEERNYEFSKELINDSLSLFGSKISRARVISLRPENARFNITPMKSEYHEKFKTM